MFQMPTRLCVESYSLLELVHSNIESYCNILNFFLVNVCNILN